MENEYLRNIEGIVQRGIRSGETIETIRKQIQDRTGKTKSKAQLLATDQIGKLNGDLTKLRQTNLGVNGYTWRNSQDRRVRTLHKNAPTGHGNRKFKWNNPPTDGHPGNPIRCRCYAEPDFTEIFEELTP